MKTITRDTRRADGLTVGEAMDKDAAFLRSVGVNAPDGALTVHEKLEGQKQIVRERVLDALDSAFSEEAYPNQGWADSDLPGLFKVLDAHTERVFNRARE